MRDVWSAEFARLGLLLVLALVLGALFDATFAALALALGGYLGWHLRNLWRLEHWLSRQRRAMPPESDGIWGAVLDHYWRIRRRDRSRKRRLAEVLRAVREANAAMPDGTVLLDAQFEIAWCNSAAEQLLGLRLKADRGQHVANLVRNPALTRLLRSPPPREPIEMESPADARRWLQIFLVDYGAGQHLLLVQDATRVHRLEQMRREFVANASHELRSPLTVIRGYLEALLDDPAVRRDWQPQVDEMRRQSDRMTGIVNDLLELSRLETETEDPGFEPVDVRGLAARIREEALALGEGPRDLELQLESPLRLGGVERELYSAFSNLVFNAMRYTPADGRVRVRWAEEGGAPVFSVEDTGIGIAAEHIPRLTERFYRVDSSRTRARGGTGLGLAIVKHVVQRHGGRLLISSTPGEGSRFTCVFPPHRAQR
jgi:two-component system phosphate regulon sensor histidine kinase PhoR